MQDVESGLYLYSLDSLVNDSSHKHTLPEPRLSHSSANWNKGQCVVTDKCSESNRLSCSLFVGSLWKFIPAYNVEIK